MKLLIRPPVVKTAGMPLTKPPAPTLVEQLIKSFADRLPQPPGQLR